MIDLFELLREIERRGASEAEISMWRSRRKRLSFTEEPGEAVELDRISLSIRVIVGKRVGVIGIEDLNRESIDKAIDRVISITKTSPEDPNWRSLNKDFGRSRVSGATYEKENIETDFSEIESMFRELRSSVHEKCKDARITRGSINISSVEYYYVNSYLNNIMSRIESGFSAYAMVRVDSNGATGTYSDFEIGRNIKREFRPRELGERIASRAIEFTNAKKTETGRYNVILDQVVNASILTVILSPAVSAENIFRGRSPLVNKLETKILSEKISIEDNGLIGEYIGSREFDDEGVKTQRTIIVDRGVLKSYLYDTYYANLMNTRSTGNAWRGLSTSPRPSHNVLIMSPGKESLSDLVRDIGRGIYVVRVIGEWLSNPVSGYIQATITHAYEISDGEIKTPLKGGTLTTNFYKGYGEDFVDSSRETRVLDRVVSPHIAMRNVVIS